MCWQFSVTTGVPCCQTGLTGRGRCGYLVYLKKSKVCGWSQMISYIVFIGSFSQVSPRRLQVRFMLLIMESIDQPSLRHHIFPHPRSHHTQHIPSSSNSNQPAPSASSISSAQITQWPPVASWVEASRSGVRKPGWSSLGLLRPMSTHPGRALTTSGPWQPYQPSPRLKSGNECITCGLRGWLPILVLGTMALL